MTVADGLGWAETEITIARFDVNEPRGFHGRWVTVGASDFAYEGPAGGGGHVRAVMAVADVIGRDAGGADTATAVRNSAKAMYARDMPTAYRHLDGAAYLDGASGGPSHRDDIEAIRASYAEVPHGVSTEPRPPAVPPELGIHQGRLKGRPVPAGITGSYVAERAWWNPRLHPRDKHGEFATKAAGDLEALSKELHQDEMAEAMLAGTFKLDSPGAYRKVHQHLMAASKALRKGDLETARHHLAKAKEHMLKLPGKAAKKHAPSIDKRLADVGKMLTGAGTGKAPKARVPVASPQMAALGGLMAMGMQRWDPRQPRGPGGQWIKVAGHLDALASHIGRHPAAQSARRAASSLRRGDREGAIRHLSHARQHLDTAKGPEAAAHRQEADRYLADLIPASLTNKELRQMAAHIPPMMNEPATHAGLAAFGAGGDAAALIHAMGRPPYRWTGGVQRWSRDGLTERLAVYRAVGFREELHPRNPKGGEHGGEFAHKPGTAVLGKAGPRFGALDSLSANTRPDGTFTPARQALHDRLITQALAGHTRSERPAATFLGGGSASGKTTMLEASPAAGALINPDDFGTQLPEYQRMTAAHDLGAGAFVHNEAAMIAAQAQDEAERRGYDYTLDGTGDSSVAKMQAKIDAAHGAGYQVAGKYVTVDTETAVERARKRAAQTGRMVPEPVIRRIHQHVSEVFPQVLGPGGLDSAELWDNNGAKPVLIGRKSPGGSWQVKDEAAWRRFLAKA